MKKIKGKINVTQLNAVSATLNELVDVKGTKFARKLMEMMRSVDKAKSNSRPTEYITEKVNRLKELDEIAIEFDTKKDEVLQKFAYKDEEGKPVTESVKTPNGAREVYVFPKGEQLNEMSKEKLAKLFSADAIKLYAMRKENGEFELDEAGDYRFADHVSIEYIERLAALNELELEYRESNDEIIALSQEIQFELFEVELDCLEESDASEFMSAKELVGLKHVSASAIKELFAQMEKLNTK